MSKNKKMLEKRVSHKSNQKAHLKKCSSEYDSSNENFCDFAGRGSSLE